MIIGITGGVGAGKSEVLKFLKEEYGAMILEMDAIGREVMEPDGICFHKVVGLFGEEILNKEGCFDRAKIAGIVFRDPEKLEALNGIVHPAVRAFCDQKIREAAEENIPYVVMESAILLDAGYEAVCDEVWYIYADEKVRAARLRESRGYSAERIRSVMASQKSDAFFREHTDFTVDNSKDLAYMKKQIIERLGK